ncbi:hypothetical protein [Vibrio taketomensis]|uniref:hypothetical protein n=1 Tax=Vibrio taketomensis TaxID=2572923 RepID=UPI001E4BF957|nr:hypothetical protein [Vibrio taketomensis]
MINTKVLAVAVLFGLASNAFASDVVINELSVRDHLYPAQFKAELQNNLNFFRDGVGVDPVAKVLLTLFRLWKVR